MGLKITVSAANPLQLSADAVAIGVPAGARRKGLLKELISAVGPTVAKAMKRAEFTGKKGQICDVPTGGKLKPGSVILVGLGDTEALTYACVRRVAAKAARRANASRYTSLGFAVPEGFEDGERAVAEGVTLGGYRFEKFKTAERQSKFPLQKVSILTDKKVNADLREEADLGQRLAEAVTIARDLINTPPNELYPETLANFCKELAKEHKKAGLTTRTRSSGGCSTSPGCRRQHERWSQTQPITSSSPAPAPGRSPRSTASESCPVRVSSSRTSRGGCAKPGFASLPSIFATPTSRGAGPTPTATPSTACWPRKRFSKRCPS